jgi:hypothetical protein
MALKKKKNCSFEIIIQLAVGNKSCYLMKNTLIITVLPNRSRKNNYFHAFKVLGKRVLVDMCACVDRQPGPSPILFLPFNI